QAVVIKTFYSKPGTDISSLSNWGSNTDGSGTSPLSFATAEQSFIVNNTCTVGSQLTIGGSNSSLTVKGTGTLTINAAFTGTLNAETTAVVNINTSQPITFGAISSNTQLNFQQNATQIPFAEYGNIRLMGSGTTKTLASDSTFVINNMTIDAGVTLNGAADNSSVLALASNFNIDETGVFNPTTKFNLYLKSQTGQQLIFRSTQANFSNIEIATASNVQVVNPVAANTTTLVLGSSTGGGLTLNSGAHLYMDKHAISIIGKGSINSLNQNGQIGFKKSNLSIVSQTNSHSYLYPITSQDSLKTLTVNLTGTGALYLQQKFYLTDSVKASNGTIHSNGNLTLVSTPTTNARIGRIEGTGKVEGAIEFQRYLQQERLYKYITFPLSGLNVADIQTTIPVTGTFTGASTGAGLSSNPSMYLYNEPLTWVSYPQVANTDTLQVGRGYSVFVRNNASDSKLILHGNIRQGNFTFDLTTNPTADPDKGWNLLGNPYPSSITWQQSSGWSSSGVNNTVYIRDNSYPGGKFFVWDGTTGDAEFSGIIPQGQAYWVRTVNSSPSLTIHETAKTSQGNGILYRVGSENETQRSLAIELKHNNLSDKTYINLRSHATNQFDELTDAVKQKNGFFNISTLSVDSVVLAINNLSTADCSHTIRLAFEATEPGEYTFKCSGSFYNDNLKSVSLHDRYLDKTFIMKLNDVYKFTITNDSLSKNINRFQLSIHTDIPQPLISNVDGILYSNINEGNQWLLNGEPIEGAVKNSYRPVKSGNYSVMVTNECVQLSDAVPFIVTGDDNHINADDIVMYPNPVNNFLHLKTDKTVTTESTYTIVDLLGRKLQTGSIQSHEFQHGTDIQLNEAVTTGFHVLILDNSRFNVKLSFLKQ
ncbi:MAG TPA: hypothetical protein VIM65_03955, partial [Cyclobacteriaceae bacterium]